MFRKPKSTTTSNLPEISQLNNFFGDLVEEKRSVSPSVNSSLTLDDPHSTQANQFSLRPLTIYATLNLLQHIKTDTAMGHDRISAFFLKKWAPFLAFNITFLFNSSLSLGAFPSLWKKANLTPVYKKKGSKNDSENYRPISILPVLGRLLERAVASQLQEHCDSFDVIPVQQFGFRKHSNCELTILAALDAWLGDLSMGKFVGALLVDLSKAFDSVSHALLCIELANIGCDDLSLEWFRNYLSSRSQRVVIGDVYSPWVTVSKGVPQGSSLSPLLFNIFVRQLPESCDGNVFQFADDLTNSAADSDPIALATKLEASYNKIKAFCDNKLLQINLTKTQLIVFKSPNKSLPPDYSITLEGILLSPSPSVHILGVTLDHHLTMGAHIQTIAKKCHGLLGVLRRAASYLPSSLLTLAYISLIRSQLEYNSATFFMAAPSHLKKLDVIQKIASRIITNSPPCTHSQPLQVALGLEPLESRRRKHIAKLVNSIITGNSHPFFRNFFSSCSDASHGSVPVGIRSLNRKRLSQFGLCIVNDNYEPKRTNLRALEPISEGRSSDTLFDHNINQANLTALSSKDFINAAVAPIGDRG